MYMLLDHSQTQKIYLLILARFRAWCKVAAWLKTFVTGLKSKTIFEGFVAYQRSSIWKGHPGSRGVWHWWHEVLVGWHGRKRHWKKNREIPNKSFAGALLFASNSMQTWMKKCSFVLHNSRKIHWFPIRALSLKNPLQSHKPLECHWKLLMWHKKHVLNTSLFQEGYIDTLMNHK